MGQAGVKLLFSRKNKGSHVNESKDILQRVIFSLNKVELLTFSIFSLSL